MANRFGLKDTYLGLILAYSTFIQPHCLWIMKEYFEQIPRESDEAALVDGASPYRAFWDIILPLARPARRNRDHRVPDRLERVRVRLT
ncbi:MAG: ABC transporter permease subunit [Thermomicrobiales bacterium]